MLFLIGMAYANKHIAFLFHVNIRVNLPAEGALGALDRDKSIYLRYGNTARYRDGHLSDSTHIYLLEA
jgi:hypothetical protein